MSTRVARPISTSALVCAVAVMCSTPAAAQFEKPYQVVELADSVFAVVWQDIMSYPVEGNHLVIMNDEDVFVIDANRTPSLADTVIAIIRRRTDNPVRYVINTHWHADHVQGNAVYLRAFPGVDIIGHAETAAGIDSVLMPYVTEVRQDAARLRQELAADTATAEGAARLEARLRNLEREERLYDAVELTRPTLVVTDSITFRRGDRRIEIIHPGPANTPGDLVVHLPSERILAVGDIVTEPFPLLGWDSPQSWSQVLDALLARKPAFVVPGHGDVMETTEYVELFRDLFTQLSAQVSERMAAGESLEQIQTAVELRQFWRAFAGENERLFQAFVERFQPIAVERAYRELRP